MRSADPQLSRETEILRLAGEVKPLAARFADIGAGMEQSAMAADAAIRENLRQAVLQLEEMAEVETSIDEFLGMMRPMEVLGAGLRRSVSPLCRR